MDLFLPQEEGQEGQVSWRAQAAHLQQEGDQWGRQRREGPPVMDGGAEDPGRGGVDAQAGWPEGYGVCWWDQKAAEGRGWWTVVGQPTEVEQVGNLSMAVDRGDKYCIVKRQQQHPFAGCRRRYPVAKRPHFPPFLYLSHSIVRS